MPPSTQRRSPRAAPAPTRTRFGSTSAAPRARPLQAPFAAVFGVLTAVVDGYLGWVLWSDPQLSWGWYLLPFLALGLLALAGAVLVHAGRGRGAALLATAGLLTGLGLLLLLVLFLLLGGGSAAWWVVFLLVAPLGALLLSAQRPVRRWTAPDRASRTPAGSRRGARAS